MKKIYFLLIGVCFSISLLGQNTVNTIVQKNLTAQERVRKIFDLTTCDKGQQDVLLKEALDSMQKCRQYIQQLATFNSQYTAEVAVLSAQLFVQFSDFQRRSCSNHLFTLKETLPYLTSFESSMPTPKRIVTSDIKVPSLKYNQTYLDELIYVNYWNCYATNSQVYDMEGMSKAAHQFIAFLRARHTNPLTFCSDLCNDSTMKTELSSLKELLTNTHNVNWGTHELDYSILRIELEAYTKAKQTSSEVLDALSKMSLLQQLLIIELSIDMDNTEEVNAKYSELTRLKEATLKLGLYDMYQKVYTALLKSTRATDEERWNYLEAMKQLALSTSTDEELTDRIQVDMIEICNRLFGRFVIEEGSEDHFTRLQVYYDLAADKNGVTKCREALASIETLRQKREKKEAFQRNWGLSVGFAPIKTLFFGGKQASYFADMTTFGLTHGFRYCTFDGFTDNYRFYSWLFKDDKPGGSFTYSGYEASYWIALYSTRDEFVQQRLCLEYRYGNYSFEPLANATLLNRSTGEAALTGITVNPVGINKDVTLVYRLQLFAGRRFFFEGNVGLGLGYRTLRADQDLKTYEIDDDSFNDVRWNRLTLPGRLGLRCGIKLF